MKNNVYGKKRTDFEGHKDKGWKVGIYKCVQLFESYFRKIGKINQAIQNRVKKLVLFITRITKSQ